MGVLRFGLVGGVPLETQNPYPFLGVILAEKVTIPKNFPSKLDPIFQFTHKIVLISQKWTQVLGFFFFTKVRPNLAKDYLFIFFLNGPLEQHNPCPVYLISQPYIQVSPPLSSLLIAMVIEETIHIGMC